MRVDVAPPGDVVGRDRMTLEFQVGKAASVSAVEIACGCVDDRGGNGILKDDLTVSHPKSDTFRLDIGHRADLDLALHNIGGIGCVWPKTTER